MVATTNPELTTHTLEIPAHSEKEQIESAQTQYRVETEAAGKTKSKPKSAKNTKKAPKKEKKTSKKEPAKQPQNSDTPTAIESEQAKPSAEEQAAAKAKAKSAEKAKTIAKTRAELKEKSPREKPFRALGFNSGVYYLMSRKQLQVLPFKARDLKETNLLQLATLGWWRNNYPKFNEKGELKDSPDWTLAANDIIQDCNDAGVYSPAAIRGLGFWRDGDRVIKHLGNILYDVTNGKKVSMLEPSLKGVYQRESVQTKRSKECADDELVALFFKAINSIYWKDKTHAQLFLGWVALALFCGWLDWRPHIWVTGEHGSGKSDTILEAIRIALGSGQYISAKGNTTEAGARQRLKCNAIPFVLDEAEPNSNKDRLRLEVILALIRNASSDDEAMAFKGTVSGESTAYRIRSMFCLASINPFINELADQSRISILEIVKMPQTTESKANFDLIKKIFLKLEREDFSTKLNNLMISRLATLETNIKVFVEAAGDHLGQARDGKQYGTLLAGYATLINPEPVDLETAKSYVEQLKLNTVVEENRDTKATGWDMCWEKMSAVRLTFRDSRSIINVGEGIEMLRIPSNEELAKIVGYEHNSAMNGGAISDDLLAKTASRGKKELERALRKLGIVYQDGTESLFGCVGEGIYLANSSEAMSKALTGTAFQNWKQHSIRIGDQVPKKIKIDGNSKRAIFIPEKQK